MRNLTVRNLPEETHHALRLRAAQNGRSMEAEVRSILELTVLPSKRLKFGTLLYQISQKAGGIGDLEPLPRTQLKAKNQVGTAGAARRTDCYDHGTEKDACSHDCCRQASEKTPL